MRVRERKRVSCLSCDLNDPLQNSKYLKGGKVNIFEIGEQCFVCLTRIDTEYFAARSIYGTHSI